MWSENKMWVLCVVAILFLFLFGLLKVWFIYFKRSIEDGKTKGKRSKTIVFSREMLIDSIIEVLSIIMEMIPVFIGALLAIIFTIYSTNQQDIDNLIDQLTAAREDISIQASLLGEVLEYYDDESLIDQLTLNTSVDLTILNLSVNSAVGLDYIPGSALGCITSNMRGITERVSVINMNCYNPNSIRRMVEEIQRFLEYLIIEIDLVIDYLNRDLSVSEYESALTEHVSIIIQENELIFVH